MLALPAIDLIEGRGVRQDRRYSHAADPGGVRKRQVSLIDEGTIRRLEERFGAIPRNLIKSQIVLDGEVALPELIGRIIRFEGGARVRLSVPRKPCFAMDFIHPGLKAAMEGGQQGALGMVIEGGRVTPGQMVEIV